MDREPLITVASITAVVAAILSLIVAFGFDVTEDQSQAILGLAAVLAPIVVGLVARGKVTPWKPDYEPRHVRNEEGRSDPLYLLVVVVVVILLVWLVLTLAGR